MAFLTLANITKSYSARPVLSNFYLSLDEGEFVSIVGASATGKTTLMKLACGLLEPDSGTITLDGAAVTGFSSQASVVFQNYSLLPWLSALENVRLAVEAAFPQYDRAQQEAHSTKYLEMVGLGKAILKKPSQLSGGMRQRVAIARAFAVEPRILFLDEPFGALDALTRATLQKELAQMCSAQARPVTALMITNSVEEAILLSDRIHGLGRAGLSDGFTVDLARPRAGDALLHDPRAIEIRNQLADFLVAGRKPAPEPVKEEVAA
jgi:nitrate/nitrite transport system ATP-binding protein